MDDSEQVCELVSLDGELAGAAIGSAAGFFAAGAASAAGGSIAGVAVSRGYGWQVTS